MAFISNDSMDLKIFIKGKRDRKKETLWENRYNREILKASDQNVLYENVNYVALQT